MKPGYAKQLMKDHKIYAKKSYGQHFLTDERVLDKIINACELTGDDLVIEIGPGTGALTKRLAERAGKVIAVEIDARLLPVLAQALTEHANAEVVNADILKTDVRALIQGAGYERAKIAANLPYNIAATVIVQLLTERCPAESIVVMVQKEVADRLAAPPGGKTYGSLSVLARYYCEPYLVANVPRNCFVPKPNVDSAVVRLKPLAEPPVDVSDEAAFLKMVRAAFLWRRKTFVNCMQQGNVCALSKPELEDILKKNNLPRQARGEDMGIEDFARVFNAMN